MAMAHTALNEFVGSLQPSRRQSLWPTLTPEMDLAPCNRRVYAGRVPTRDVWLHSLSPPPGQSLCPDDIEAPIALLAARSPSKARGAVLQHWK